MVAEVATTTPAFPEALTWPEKARSIQIVDAASYTLAANQKKDLATLRKRIVTEFEPMKKASHAAWKAVVAKENEHLEPIEEAENILTAGIKQFEFDEERKRREIQRRLDEEQRQRDEADRLRREAEAKAIRDEELRVQAEIRAKDEAARLARAIEAEAAGASEATVAEIVSTPVLAVPEVAPITAYIEPAPYIAPVVAAPTYDRVKGIGIRETWSAQIVSIKDLCRAVADGRVPEMAVQGNMPWLNNRARSDKRLMQIPGVRAVAN